MPERLTSGFYMLGVITQLLDGEEYMQDLQERQMYLEINNDNKMSRGMIKVRVEDDESSTYRFAKSRVSNPTKRGKVRGFSPRAKKNISDKIQTVDYYGLTDGDKHKAVFLTLTYGQKYPEADEAKKHFFCYCYLQCY